MDECSSTLMNVFQQIADGSEDASSQVNWSICLDISIFFKLARPILLQR